MATKSKQPEPSDEISVPARARLIRELGRKQIVLREAASIARVTSGLIDERYEFEIDEPDLGYLCLLACELLEAVCKAIENLTKASERFPPTLAQYVEAQRQQLFRIQAAMKAMAFFARVCQSDHSEMDLFSVFSKLDDMCESTLADLDLVSLGLPIS